MEIREGRHICWSPTKLHFLWEKGLRRENGEFSTWVKTEVKTINLWTTVESLASDEISLSPPPTSHPCFTLFCSFLFHRWRGQRRGLMIHVVHLWSFTGVKSTTLKKQNDKKKKTQNNKNKNIKQTIRYGSVMWKFCYAKVCYKGHHGPEPWEVLHNVIRSDQTVSFFEETRCSHFQTFP